MLVKSPTINVANLEKLVDLNNSYVLQIVEQYIELCKPDQVIVFTESEEDQERIRQLSLNNNEETLLKTQGHSIHYDGYFDQGRDKDNTAVLLPKNQSLSKHINSKDRESGLKEIFSLMDGIMSGKTMYVRFYCLGPKDSKFSISIMQITDSAYVCHSEDLLYRQGYDQFKKMNGSGDFYHLIHSSGELKNNVSKNFDKRRVYIDLEENRVLTINNQYAGNSVGCKKLSLRLAINQAIANGWLTEHMFISGIISADKSRKTYFLGAYPSACGKTSTAMIPGHTIVGDDIAYIKMNDDGVPHAANIEQGIFGIIKDVNPEDDALIFKVLTSPREMIFSNVLVSNGKVYWNGMGEEDSIVEGVNHSGIWQPGKLDNVGNKIPISHPNARYTIRLRDLENCDENLHNPNGVPFHGILYGGRDTNTAVPISQALNWNHGVLNGASIESETTAATLGKVGVRAHQPMANLDFVVVPLGKYLSAHIEFGKKFKEKEMVKVFSTNYFLQNDQGKFIDDKVDKKIWLVWSEGRIHGDYDAIETPIGYIPKYEDLKTLFGLIFNKVYTKQRYDTEFSIRIDNYLSKLDRVKIFYEGEDIPVEFSTELEAQISRLVIAKEKFGKSIIFPEEFL